MAIKFLSIGRLDLPTTGAETILARLKGRDMSAFANNEWPTSSWNANSRRKVFGMSLLCLAEKLDYPSDCGTCYVAALEWGPKKG